MSSAAQRSMRLTLLARVPAMFEYTHNDLGSTTAANVLGNCRI